MLPIALAQGIASEWKNGLAWVNIGGLLSSMILTVYLVPMVYYVVDKIKEKRYMRKTNLMLRKPIWQGYKMLYAGSW